MSGKTATCRLAMSLTINWLPFAAKPTQSTQLVAPNLNANRHCLRKSSSSSSLKLSPVRSLGGNESLQSLSSHRPERHFGEYSSRTSDIQHSAMHIRIAHLRLSLSEHFAARELTFNREHSKLRFSYSLGSSFFSS